ncbi:hypothetical protein GCM10009827_048980 [Dactylosporangium maewongense]|uniref:Integral membrane protein n=1 Tax=Dactylosporangium maewongense TaxID=634393 RepID=A0ABP4LKZ8_9ACTN
MSRDPTGDDEAERWTRFARAPHPPATHPGRVRKAVAVYVAAVSAVACGAMTELGRLDHESPSADFATPLFWTAIALTVPLGLLWHAWLPLVLDVVNVAGHLPAVLFGLSFGVIAAANAALVLTLVSAARSLWRRTRHHP